MPYSDPEKQKEYQRQWIANRRQKYFINKICQKCGSDENLEIRHKDQKEKVSHRVWSWSESRIKVELDKCIILCHDCHLIETKEQYKNNLKHGSKTIAKSGCTCEPCLEYNETEYEKRCDRYYLTGK